MKNLWLWGRVNHRFYRGCSSLNQGHLALPVFNDHRTLICKMI
jgi:hypothetical protein